MRHVSSRASASLVLAAVSFIPACGNDRLAAPPDAANLSVSSAPPAFAYAGQRLGRPAREQLTNTNGSLRVWTQAEYDQFFAEVGPFLEQWGADPRLAINPNFVAALLAKESGFQTFAISFMPANGYPQMTHIADLDLRQMVSGTAFSWMQPEVESWPRHPSVHAPDASRQRTLALIDQGAVTSENEYFFHRVRATRGGLLWLRLLANVWTSDAWPGMYGSFARQALNGGAPLTDAQLFDLVTVSYNRGYPWVRDLVGRFGPAWTSQLAAQGAEGIEAADYLERVRTFTVIFQQAAGTAAPVATVPSSPTDVRLERIVSGIVVRWTDRATNEESQTLWRSYNGGPWTEVARLAPNVVIYGDPWANRTGTFRYGVAATNAAGTSTPVASPILDVPPVPAAPSYVALERISSGIVITWDDRATGEEAYILWMSYNGSGFMQVAHLAPNTTSYSDTWANRAGTFKYAVTATNTGGPSARTESAVLVSP